MTDALSHIYEPAASEMAYTIKEPTPISYVRRFLGASSFPERFRTWQIRDSRLYHYRPDPFVASAVGDLNDWKLVPSDEERIAVLEQAHDEPQLGHLGVQKTYSPVVRDYYWPGCYRDIMDYVKQCPLYQACKVDQRAPAGLMGQRVVEQPWLVVATDIMGPLPTSKASNQYVLRVPGFVHEWVEIIPLRAATGRKVSESFRIHLINCWGTPQVLLIDNGSKFVNHTIRALAQEYGIVHNNRTPLPPPSHPLREGQSSP